MSRRVLAVLTLHDGDTDSEARQEILTTIVEDVAMFSIDLSKLTLDQLVALRDAMVTR